MQYKDTSVVMLTEQASQKLAKILHQPPTEQQKRSFIESIGTYAFYQKRWQKKV